MQLPALELVSRDELLVDRCAGRRVLHVGCTDHPLLDERLAEGRLLHQRVHRVASDCVGVDIDAEGIARLAGAMPDAELIHHDAEELASCRDLAGRSFDVVLAADVVEHLSNSGRFLQQAGGLLADGGRLIVTVPNAFSAKRTLGVAFLGNEHVHPDHTAYFSLSTLTTLLDRAGYELDECFAFQWVNPTTRNRVANAVTRPLVAMSRNRLADELAVVARPASGGDREDRG